MLFTDILFNLATRILQEIFGVNTSLGKIQANGLGLFEINSVVSLNLDKIGNGENSRNIHSSPDFSCLPIFI